MRWTDSLWMILLAANVWSADANKLMMTVSSSDDLVIGHVASVRFEIQNTSEDFVAILEIRPEQPCEEPIVLVQPLIGSIRYDQEKDEYIYDPMAQSATQMPALTGLIPPGNKLALDLRYRPFARRETFTIEYAVTTGKKVYLREKANDLRSRFSPRGSDYGKAIVPDLMRIGKSNLRLEAVFPEIVGQASKLCYCETLGAYAGAFPVSLCKDWDTGAAVDFRVGGEQEIDGEEKSVEWKFQREFPAHSEEGELLNGQFVTIPPDKARQFMKIIENRYFIKRIDYSSSKYYYDLEPSP